MDNTDKVFVCGIDIGIVNLCFCFVSSDTIIAFRGTCRHMYRYEMDKPVIELKINSYENDDIKCISKLIDSIPEFFYTYKVRIEKQVSGFKKFIGGKMQTISNNPDIIRYEAAIYMGIFSKFQKMDLEYYSPKKRNEDIAKIFKEIPMKENTYLPKKSVKKEKIPSMDLVSNFYPEFYNFVITVVGDNKLDDICDCVAYAILETSLCPLNYNN